MSKHVIDRTTVTVTKSEKFRNGVTRLESHSVASYDKPSQGLGLQLLTFSIYSIFLALFCVAFYRYTAGMPLPTFTGFLEFLPTIPNLTLSPEFLGSIAGDWGIFEFLRLFINSLISILGVGLYACSCILQVITFVSWFLIWAFGIV